MGKVKSSNQHWKTSQRPHSTLCVESAKLPCRMQSQTTVSARRFKTITDKTTNLISIENFASSITLHLLRATTLFYTRSRQRCCLSRLVNHSALTGAICFSVKITELHRLTPFKDLHRPSSRPTPLLATTPTYALANAVDGLLLLQHLQVALVSVVSPR